MDTTLVADRFVRLSAECAFDLATGERTLLHIESATSRTAEQRWAEQWAAVCGLWHPHLAECLDFGGLGAAHRFVSYRIGESDSLLSAPASWRRIATTVQSFLTACQIEPVVTPVVLTDLQGRRLKEPMQMVRPAAGTNGCAADAWEHDGSVKWFGIRLVDRGAVQTVVEHLTLATAPGFTQLVIEAAQGSGGRTFLRTCAREARRHGYVPICAAGVRWIERQSPESIERWTSTLRRRPIAVLHDGRRARLESERDMARALLRLSAHGASSRVIIELVPPAALAVCMRLTPLPEETLIAMVVRSGNSKPLAGRISRAARASRGHPGPFIRSLVRLYGSGSRRKSLPYTVHETSTDFSTGADRAARSRMRGRCRRTSRSQVVNLGAHVAIDAAAVLIARGRHAAAERALRQAHAAATRRGLWLPAGDLAVASGRLLASRARTTEAAQAFDEAIECYGRAGSVEGTAAAVVHLGWVRLQEAHIEESEGSFRSALPMATQIDVALAARWTSCALAVCLWWQGRSDEAHAVLGSASDDKPVLSVATRAVSQGWPPARHVEVWRACVGARIALALGDPCLARAHLDRAAAHVAAAGEMCLRALVCRAEARWHSAVGDVSGLRAAAREAIRVATEARQPLDRLRALTGYLEGCARLGVDIEPDAIRRLERAPLSVLPKLLALRIRVAIGLWRRALPNRALVAECAARRLEALRVTDPPTAQGKAQTKRSAMYEDVIDILRICQEEDPCDALRRVADIVKQRTRAAVVEFSAVNGAKLAGVPAGARPSSVAIRAAEGDLPIEPTTTDRGMEAAVPLRSGGQVVGSLAVRWVGPVSLETPRLMGLLTAIAAAAAPCLQSVVERQVPAGAGPHEIELIGESLAIRELRRAVARAADAPFPVLIQGESGSGKELVARAIHRTSGRRSRVFCALNCAALPDDLLEAELFGHARGAFTGAMTDRPGLFEEADGGVLFLDEVGELTPRGQAKLLRAIQEGEIKRVGETFPRKVDARIVAATNRPLEQEVLAGRFRRDLRYRLDVIRLVVPPLRDRPEDIPLLVATFWRQATDRVGSRAVLTGAVVSALARYDWPGNVRELQNVLAALAVTAPRRGTVGSTALPAALAGHALRGASTTLDEARRVFEERYVRAALARAGGHRGRAAAELGMTRQGLAKLLGRLGVAAEIPVPPGTAPPAESPG